MNDKKVSLFFRTIQNQNFRWLAVVCAYQVILFFTVLTVYFFRSENPNISNFFAILRGWDAKHYITLARAGYGVTQSVKEQFHIVYFPFFAFLIRILYLIIPSFTVSSLVISTLGSITGHYFFIKIATQLKLSKEIIIKSLLLLFVSPISFYFITGYSESIFFAISTLSFYLLLKNNHIGVGIAGFFASLTRITGVTLFIPYLIHFFSSPKKFLEKFIFFLYIPLGFFIYLTINKIYFDSFFFYQTVMREYFTKEMSNPILNYKYHLVEIYKQLSDWPITFSWNFFSDLCTTIIFPIVVLLFCIFKNIKFKIIPVWIIAWLGVNWIIPASQSFWLSNTRYLMALFPIYWILGSLTEKKHLPFLIVFCFFLGWLLTGILSFVEGGLVY